MSQSKYLRQLDFAKPELLTKSITMIGAGGIGSPTALALMKMGDFKIEVWDDDAVSEWNQPSTLYGPEQVGEFKVDMLTELIHSMTGRYIIPVKIKVHDDTQMSYGEIMIVGTDNMTSRKNLWERFKNTPSIKYFIDARMGGEGCQVYSIPQCSVPDGYLGKEHEKPMEKWINDVSFYESMLFEDKDSDQHGCSARAIIYNTFMIASLIARSVKGYCTGEKFPREIIADCNQLNIMVTE